MLIIMIVLSNVSQRLGSEIYCSLISLCLLKFFIPHLAGNQSAPALVPAAVVTYPSEMDGVPKISLPVFGLASYKFKLSLWTDNGQLVSSLLQDADNWLSRLLVNHPDFRFFCRRWYLEMTSLLLSLLPFKRRRNSLSSRCMDHLFHVLGGIENGNSIRDISLYLVTLCLVFKTYSERKCGKKRIRRDQKKDSHKSKSTMERKESNDRIKLSRENRVIE